MGIRANMLKNWVKNSLPEPENYGEIELVPVTADASFRRYFRVCASRSTLTYIAMDAPPENERCESFVVIANALAEIGLLAPRVLAADLEHGFLLLTDLGDKQYLGLLNEGTVDQLYSDALAALLVMQDNSSVKQILPTYSKDMLIAEMRLFIDWFVNQFLGIDISNQDQVLVEAALDILACSALNQPQVWVHRDYHSRNLMLVDDVLISTKDGVRCPNPGILDFQDSVIGPVTYDLVSLLRDCYIAWPDSQVYKWVEQFRENLISMGIVSANMSSKEFARCFDWMGVQRHLKAIGIFSRLKLRDNKPGYLADIPRTLRYIVHVCSQFSELDAFNHWLSVSIIPTAYEKLDISGENLINHAIMNG